ncbi:hypothetical protein BDF20DRAFT_840148 [Mycotypha africana]|uniref:uncharacterized protein n=1 Tax=Mycotypha africana TaxID=64632 RepID=UPI002300193C|nr:uncharacterized protein BDF20DRAFT_840148 [Mycotypha africana]KAI8967605.1 hypothetical protein BDF20DRAFT_840148 [Mycotypha africana]
MLIICNFLDHTIQQLDGNCSNLAPTETQRSQAVQYLLVELVGKLRVCMVDDVAVILIHRLCILNEDSSQLQKYDAGSSCTEFCHLHEYLAYIASNLPFLAHLRLNPSIKDKNFKNLKHKCSFYNGSTPGPKPKLFLNHWIDFVGRIPRYF